MKYIHYGHDKFDESKFEKVENIPFHTKAKGGFWATRIEAEYGWKEWCEGNEFNLESLHESMKFTLKKDSRILTIENSNQLKDLPKYNNDLDGLELTSFAYLDFEKLSIEYDAIEVLISKDHQLYFNLYGWDCDSIFIMNANIIIPEK